MAKLNLSTKRLQIDRANVVIVAATSVAAFITIFSLVSCRALLSQRAYQGRVIAKKEVAKKQLQQNLNSVNTLLNSYQQFVSTPENVIGGTPTGQGDKDGDNARIVLDALPSKYDFPAVTSSLEKMVAQNKGTLTKIDGTDDEVAQEQNAQSDAPQPVEIPFEVAVDGDYSSIKDLIGTLERSIRPITTTSLTMESKDGNISLDIKAKTYYQPEKTLNIRSEVVR